MEWTDHRGQIWDVTLEWAEVNGRPVIVGLTLEGNEGANINTATLKELPLGRFDRENRPTPTPITVPSFPARRGISLKPEGLQAVAAVYRQAWSEKRPVQQAVADAFGIARGTAANRIAQARREGFLPAVVRRAN